MQKQIMFRAIKKPLIQQAREKFFMFDWLFFSLVILLISAGLLTIYSVDKVETNYLVKHSLRIAISIGIFFIVAFTNIKFWYRYAYVFYLIVLGLLFYVSFFGFSALGAKRWINLYFFNIQPSELMKVAVILALARYYQFIKIEDIDRLSNLIIPLFIIIIPFFLVANQPDLGTGIFILIVSIGMLWLAGLNLKIFLTGLVSLFVLAPFVISFLKPYQQKRILTFLNPENDPLGSGYQVIQSKIAIGSAGFFGKGFKQGSQSNLEFLPEKHTDFIFTVFAEQFGFLGSLLLIFIFFGIILTILTISLQSQNNFSRLVCFGIGFNIFIYLAVNLGMVTGLLPVVGVPLPIISYGGTAMLTTMFALGIVMSAKIHKEYKL
jgi:rod shape determining protein RodA